MVVAAGVVVVGAPIVVVGCASPVEGRVVTGAMLDVEDGGSESPEDVHAAIRKASKTSGGRIRRILVEDTACLRSPVAFGGPRRAAPSWPLDFNVG